MSWRRRRRRRPWPPARCWRPCSGSPSDDIPPEAETWAEDNAADPSGELIERAIAVIDRVLENSELRPQWEDSDDGENWQTAVDDLRGRLDENLP